jgi:hypothetical protein
VPTLTTVLEPASEEVPQAPSPAAAANAAAGSATPAAAAAGAAAPAAHSVALDPEAKISEADAFRLEEQLLHRVLQRVDLSLEERVSDAVAGAVQLHLDAMIPGLRAEIEQVLRALVSEALARELSDTPRDNASIRG